MKNYIVTILNENGNDFEIMKDLLFPISEDCVRVGNVFFVKSTENLYLDNLIVKNGNFSPDFSFLILEDEPRPKLFLSNYFTDIEILKKEEPKNEEIKESTLFKKEEILDKEIDKQIEILELDRILDKIYQHGTDSLTENEKNFLNKYGK